MSRNSIAEDRNTVEKLISMNLAVEIDYKKGFDIENILKQLDELNVQNNNYEFKNQYKDIGNKIISFMEEG